MKAWKLRLYEERTELADRYTKLGNFLVTADIAADQLYLLREQYNVMYQYLAVLDKRIALIHKETK